MQARRCWKLVSPEERIGLRIKPNGECREWTGCMSRKDPVTGVADRPVMRYEQRQQLVSRVVWKLTYGQIADGMVIAHHCDNPKCIRTSHLYEASQSRNILDAVSRNRWKAPRLDNHNMAKLTCAQVAVIRERRAAGVSAKSLASEYGVCVDTIWLLLRRKTWNT